MLRAVFGFFLSTDPESQDAEGGYIQAVDGRVGMLVGAYSHEGGTRAQRQVLGFVYLLIFDGKCFILGFPELRCTPSTLDKHHVLFPYLAKLMKTINTEITRTIEANSFDQIKDIDVKYP
jgi:hypothetical protein